MLKVPADLNIAYASKVKIVIPWTKQKEHLNQKQEVTAQSLITVGMDSNSAAYLHMYENALLRVGFFVLLTE